MFEPFQNDSSRWEDPATQAWHSSELDHVIRVLDGLAVGACIRDADGHICYVNHAACALWGGGSIPEDLEDCLSGCVNAAPMADGQVPGFSQAVHSRDMSAAEFAIAQPDGRRCTLRAHSSPLPDRFGQRLATLHVLIDISDHVQAEAALKDADRCKDEFMATLAHELRNPLAPICNAVQILQTDNASASEQRWALGVLDRQLRQVGRLIDDLSDLARISGNRLELRKMRVGVADFMTSAVEISRPLIEAAGHELTVSIPAEPLCVQGDAARLVQVLCNLLNNSAKFTTRGGRIWLSAERQKNEVVIVVQDTGIGIAAEMLPVMFEMFVQAERSPDRAAGGLGIGLTLARRLVALHGGTITAYSDGKGKGSLFKVCLPLTEDLPAPGPGERMPDGSPGHIAPEATPLRVLVVDDDGDSAASMALLLRFMGHEVSTAADGREALARADRERPDAILLDISLPGMNGYGVAREIRGLSWGKNLRLVAITGWGQPADRARAAAAGFDHHLVKPVDTGALTAALASVPPAREHS